MSQLQQLLVAAKQGLMPWEKIPESEWASIAANCGEAEAREIESRIEALQNELDSIEDWDGDTQADIREVIGFFTSLSALIEQGK